jgi:hypothetical protein
VKDYDYAMVREAQERVAYISGNAAQARAVGIDPTTWHRWSSGDIRPLRGPGDVLRRFLGIDEMAPKDARRFLDKLAEKWPAPATPPTADDPPEDGGDPGVDTATDKARPPKDGTGGGDEDVA